MNQKKPRINVPLTPIDLWVERCSFFIFFLIWAYVLLNYNSIPETVPLHFDAQGNADNFGSKHNIWILMGIMTLLFIGIYILGKSARYLRNYTVTITEDNALKNYRFSARILRIVNLFDLLLFAYIVKTTMAINHEKTSQLGSWFLPLVLGSSGIFLVAIFIYAAKLNSKSSKNEH